MKNHSNYALFPISSFEYKTNHSKANIFSQIEQHIVTVNELSVARKTISIKKFEGLEYNDQYLIRRIPKYGYSALIPITSISVTEHDNGNNLTIKIMFNKAVNLFLVVFLSLFILRIVTTTLTNSTIDMFADEIVFFIIPYIIIMIIYNIELVYVKNFIRNIA